RQSSYPLQRQTGRALRQCLIVPTGHRPQRLLLDLGRPKKGVLGRLLVQTTLDGGEGGQDMGPIGQRSHSPIDYAALCQYTPSNECLTRPGRQIVPAIPKAEAAVFLHPAAP